MAYWRGQLDLAIPSEVWENIPVDRKIAFRDEVRAMKALSEKINEGLPNEENTTIANWHICGHDEDVPCGEIHDV